MRPKAKKLFLIAPFAIVGIALFIFLGGWIVMHLWNWLLPGLFGWRLITFWQALGLLVLCRILFGGVSGRGMRRSDGRHLGGRWSNMTPEEREKFREGMRAKWGFGDNPTQEKPAEV
jgi:MFS family permease